MKDTHGYKSKNAQTHSNSVVFVLQVSFSSYNFPENNNTILYFLVEISDNVERFQTSSRSSNSSM